MPHPLILKSLKNLSIPPHLMSYDDAVRDFSWSTAAKELEGLPDGKGFNIGYETVDRHTNGKNPAKLAFRFLRKNGEIQNISYQTLSLQTNRFANLLKNLGVKKGDKIFTLLGRVPELYIAALGTLKNGSVYCPLFSAFGPEPIQTRISLGEGKVLVTSRDLYQKKILKIIDQLPSLQFIILVDEKKDWANSPKVISWKEQMNEAEDSFTISPTNPEDQALLHFTSGTTGKPKGAIHVHQAILAHHMTGKFALDFHPEDIFWCTADPGWVTGTSYGIIAPLSHGITSIVDENEFDAERWTQILEEQKVSVWYTAPTAIRMMMKNWKENHPRHLNSLRFIASVGEPLNPEAVLWGEKAFGLPIHDNWWQTETGGIMIANYLAMDIKPGSMGKPLPGIEAVIVRRTADQKIEIVQEPNQEGELALRKGWPSMFRGYLHEEERYRKCFIDDWYLTGDLAKRDEEGYFWFVGRADDIIKSAGHLIGPFEVESVLMEHPAVAEAAVIGKPDPIIFERVKAFVSLKEGFQTSEELKQELLAHARKRLGAAIAPKEIEILDSLPKTRSGKMMRRLLKARELGLPEGDTSMLEGSS